MTFIKEWYDETDNTWVMQFGVDEEELATIQKIEAEQGRSFSEIISDWLAWVIENPKEAEELMKNWR